MRALVIGYGSIGQRHARILAELGCETAVLSQRDINYPNVYASLDQALSEYVPDYVVIANQTARHHDTLVQLEDRNYRGVVLVEKPLFERIKLAPAGNERIFVAYNLRFHPVLQRLRALLIGQVIISIHAYVGQYLPDWRPGSDYRESYSSHAAQGGGALRDLSHELDYLQWLAGPWLYAAALGGHFSSLDIDSDDVFALLMKMEACPAVTLQMNYLDRVGRRCMVINTQAHTIEVDLGKGMIAVDGKAENHTVGRDDSYRAMHQAILHGETDSLCSLAEGMTTLQLIEAAEQSNKNGNWIKQ